jgi:NADH-quinone oxidoreductase subunit G
MTKLIVDGKEIEVPAEFTLLQACEAAGAEIPRFCFHERLSIAGNCRMCLVELSGSPKPVASCAWAVRDCRPGPNGEPPVVKTNSPMVKKAREGVMEFLLINHPLDCPICDQGGECDLQDQAMAYGVDFSRYREPKRASEDKIPWPAGRDPYDPLHFLHPLRPLHHRGRGHPPDGPDRPRRGCRDHLVSGPDHRQSELQGNIIDLCPVGALVASLCLYRAPVGVDQDRVHRRDGCPGVEHPRRYQGPRSACASCRATMTGERGVDFRQDALRLGRSAHATARPPVCARERSLAARNLVGGLHRHCVQGEAGGRRKDRGIIGDLVSVEEAFAVKDLMGRLGSPHIDCRQDGTELDPALGRASYLFNATIAGIEEADGLIIVGSNPRKEASIVNARIRKRWLRGDFPIWLIGEQADLTYDYQYLGSGAESLAKLAKDAPAKMKRPIILVGQGALARPDGAAVLSLAAQVAKTVGAINSDWNGFSVLHTAASRVGALDVGAVPGSGGLGVAGMLEPGNLDVLFLLGADEIDAPDGTFAVYLGTHGDRGAHRADVILPGAAYTEKNAIYVNTEGRPQLANRAAFPPGDAREDWAILRALSEALGAKFDYDSLAELRRALYEQYPHLA